MNKLKECTLILLYILSVIQYFGAGTTFHIFWPFHLLDALGQDDAFVKLYVT